MLVFKGEFRLAVESNAKPVDCFKLIFTEKFYSFLLNQFNKRIVIENNSESSQITEYLNTTVCQNETSLVTLNKIKKFIALNLYMGIERKPEIKNYWIKSTDMY